MVALGKKEKCHVFGNDFETKDGTGIRDYIHISDLSNAHIKAIESESVGIFNLGIGRGYSVMEVIKTCEEITEVPISYEILPRRPGDPAEIVADSSKAQTNLNWKPKHSNLKKIIRSAWVWHTEQSRF